MSAVPNESRKRNRKRYAYGYFHTKRHKGPRELDVGMEGILVTCNNEKTCTPEALNLLSEYADKLYGPDSLHDGAESINEELEAGAPRPQQEKYFQAMKSGAHNVIFIRTQNFEPDKLVHSILSDLHTTKEKKSNEILRMLPVTGTCMAFHEEIVRYLTTFLEPWFRTPNYATYHIAFKGRDIGYKKTDEIMKSIAGVLGRLNRKNKLELTNPQLTIIIEVIKAVCCISVVRDYKLYRKYNIQEILKVDAPKPDATSAKTDANKPEEEGNQKEEETKHEDKTGDEENGKNVSEDDKEVDKGQGEGE
ncbi:THUMP domain-containing protein 1-like [Solea solea]|uniref:THUMP domain-containing protein 1-like n=1 Tax=Solea solea TaxID=90069 RepID=UPI00272BE9D9|nr:THUMP domain-containing protein 1-like [Solea solea]